VAAVTHSSDLTDSYLTKILMGLSHLFVLLDTDDTTALPNNELSAQQNQMTDMTNINKHHDTEM
jgi:hypothetical protein